MNENLIEKELEILREAVKNAEKNVKQKIINTPDIKNIINIVEKFISKKKLICYGGTAINNIISSEDQFYDKTLDIPDYDFFSDNALEDAIELADLYYNSGYDEVEAKAGVHHGTYKVFVNFIPIADITSISETLYLSLKKEAISVSNILYCPPNFLRMLMYLELSRPSGNISRWEKVLKRLTLLNKNYPLKSKKCFEIDIQRPYESKEDPEYLYETIRNSFIDQGVVFFGGYANALYSKYMPKKIKTSLKKIPDFDVLSEDPDKTLIILKERLKTEGFKKIKIIKHEGMWEILSSHYEIMVGNETVAFVYEPIACHSYNVISEYGKKIKIATIDTMLSFYLTFIYANKPYYDPQRILCMCQHLFDVQQANRLSQKGLLKRFSIECYGKQKTIEDMRSERNKKYGELKKKKKSIEYNQWFLNYRPANSKKGSLKDISVSKPKPKQMSKSLSVKSSVKSNNISKSRTYEKTQFSSEKSKSKKKPAKKKKKKKKTKKLFDYSLFRF